MRHSIFQAGLYAAFIILAGLVGAQRAGAFERNISFCNRTTSDVHVAIAFDREGTSQITSKGWYRVRGCTCRSIVSANLRATEIFFLATRSGLDNILQGGRAPICVHPNSAFEFVGQNDNAGRCAAAGGQMATFKWYDTADRTNYRLNLRSSGQCNLMGD